jgi:hypothetical protein
MRIACHRQKYVWDSSGIQKASNRSEACFIGLTSFEAPAQTRIVRDDVRRSKVDWGQDDCFTVFSKDPGEPKGLKGLIGDFLIIRIFPAPSLEPAACVASALEYQIALVAGKMWKLKRHGLQVYCCTFLGLEFVKFTWSERWCPGG